MHVKYATYDVDEIEAMGKKMVALVEGLQKVIEECRNRENGMGDIQIMLEELLEGK